MKIAVSVMTYNRLDLFKLTLRSLLAAPDAFALSVVDGGSQDVAQRDLVSLFRHYQAPSRISIGASMNLAAGLALAGTPDIVVISADDYDYRPSWLSALRAFWSDAPRDIVLASLNWEPSYPWNQVEQDLVIGYQRVLIRASIPGSSWSFRASDWPMIGPVADKTGGEDHEVNQRLRAAGYRLAALDLSYHIGEKHSAWGNTSWTIAQPLAI